MGRETAGLTTRAHLRLEEQADGDGDGGPAGSRRITPPGTRYVAQFRLGFRRSHSDEDNSLEPVRRDLLSLPLGNDNN